MRPKLTLEERQRRAAERFQKRLDRRSAKVREQRERLAMAVERVNTRAREEMGRLRQQVSVLETEINPGGEAMYLGQELRDAIKAYRARQAWSVRLMAKVCRVTSEQIRRIEGDRTSILMGVQTVNRILRAIGSPEVPTGGWTPRPRVRAKGVGRQSLLKAPAVLTGADRQRPDDPIWVNSTEKHAWPCPDLRKELADYRQDRRWTVKQMAKECGVYRYAIESLESERPVIWMYASTLDRILRGCGRQGIQIRQVERPAPEIPSVMDSVVVVEGPIAAEAAEDEWLTF